MGKLIRVNIATATVTVVASGLDRAVGLVIDPAARTAYVTERTGGRLLAVDIGVRLGKGEILRLTDICR
jgi:sugar lactone lactonase YvrE